MRNNKGYSLFELLISIAIFSVVMLGIVSIMNSTAVFYRGGQQEVRLQEEAQVALNQIEDLLIDLDDRIAVNNDTAASREYTVYKNGSTYGLKQDGDRLLYRRVSAGVDSGWVFMADGVKDFKISGIDYHGGTERNSGDNRVSVSLDVENGKYEYSAKKDVYFRNAIENEVPFTVPDMDDASSGGDEDEYDYIYTIRRGEELNLFSEFNIVSNADLFSESSLDVLQYFDITQSTDATTGITDYIVTTKGVLDSFSATLTQSSKLGVKGTDSKGEEVKVLLLVDDVEAVCDIPLFQFTTESPTNAGSPKWIEFKGIDFRGYTNCTYDLVVYKDNNGNASYNDGVDLKCGNYATNCSFGTNQNVLSYDVNSLANNGYISAKINVGVKACDNTGYLMIYQHNDKCEGGDDFVMDGKKYMQVNVYVGGYLLEQIPLRLYTHGSKFFD